MRQLQPVTECHHAELPAEHALVNVTEPWAEAAVSTGGCEQRRGWEILNDRELLMGLLLLFSRQVVSDSVRSHPWSFPGKNAGVDCHLYSRGSSRPRQGSNPCHLLHLLHWSVESSPLYHLGSPCRCNIQFKKWRATVPHSPWLCQFIWNSPLYNLYIIFLFFWNKTTI